MSRRTPSCRPTVVAAGLTALALALAGCSGSADVPSAAPVAVGVPASAAPVAPEPVQSVAPSPVASATAVPRASAAPTRAAAPSYDVAAVQRTLASLKYYGGPVDGAAGPALRSAVMAFQKVNGLGVDGGVGPATLRALEAPRVPTLRGSSSATGSRST